MAASIAEALPGVRWLDRFDHWRQRHSEAGFGIILGLQLLTIFVMSPLAAVGVFNPMFLELLRFVTAATAILIVARNRVISATVAVTFAISLLCTLYIRSGVAGQEMHIANVFLTVAFELAVVWTVAHAAFSPGRISVYRIMGAVLLYLYIALIFTSLYRLAIDLLPQVPFAGLTPFSRSKINDLMYFSLGQLTSSGSSIIAVHPFVRALAELESIIGQLFPATFLARLVTLHGTTRRRGFGRRKKA